MKTLLQLARIACFAFSVSACNQGGNTANTANTAQVISSTPIHSEVITPRQECWDENARATTSDEEMDMEDVAVGDGSTGTTHADEEGRMFDLVPVPVPGERSAAAPVAGAIVGGVVGQQFGGGLGRALATGVGAVAGGVAGDRIASGDPGKTDYVLMEVPRKKVVQQHCRTVEDRQIVLDGYSVVYRYNGRDMTAHLPYDPGATVTVNPGAPR